jgi:glutaredoxin
VSGRSALIGICVLVVVGGAALGALKLWPRSPRDARGPRTLPELVLGRGRQHSFTFVDASGALQTVESLEEVPADSREFVKIVDRAARRTLRTATLVYVADLRVQPALGRVPYRVMTESQFNEVALPQSSALDPKLRYEPEPPTDGPLPAPGRGRDRDQEASRARGAKDRAAAADARTARQTLERLRASTAPDPTVPGRAAERRAPAARPRDGAHRVVLYVTAWCPVCTKARAYLRSRSVSFEEHDIEKDEIVAQEYARKCHAAGLPTGRVPGIEVAGKLTIGFAPARLASLLAR